MKLYTKTAIVGIVLLVGTGIAYAPAIVATKLYSRCANDLLFLASMDPTELTYRPFSTDTVLISPAMAEWILMTLDYPYTCESSHAEEISSFVRAIGGDVQNTEPVGNAALVLNAVLHRCWRHPSRAGSEARMKRLLEHFVGQGMPYDNYSRGQTPFHKAIGCNDVEMAKILLEAGADLNAQVMIQGTWANGVSAVEYAIGLHEHSSIHGDIATFMSDLEQITSMGPDEN